MTILSEKIKRGYFHIINRALVQNSYRYNNPITIHPESYKHYMKIQVSKTNFIPLLALPRLNLSDSKDVYYNRTLVLYLDTATPFNQGTYKDIGRGICKMFTCCTCDYKFETIRLNGNLFYFNFGSVFDYKLNPLTITGIDTFDNTIKFLVEKSLLFSNSKIAKSIINNVIPGIASYNQPDITWFAFRNNIDISHVDIVYKDLTTMVHKVKVPNISDYPNLKQVLVNNVEDIKNVNLWNTM